MNGKNAHVAIGLLLLVLLALGAGWYFRPNLGVAVATERQSVPRRDSGDFEEGAPLPSREASAMRRAIAAEIEKQRPLVTSPAALDAYLEEARRRGKRNRAISAFEVEPGVALIDALTPILGVKGAMRRKIEFTSAMSRLAESFSTAVPPNIQKGVTP